jgi:protein-S-isoprenylcysteine O-methyltransferase Ste14
MSALFARALFAFLVLPGAVGFLVPWLLLPSGQVWPLADHRGWALFVPGIVLLLACVREFYVAGKGTLAPWAPPRHLVVTGLYRVSRNPMYVGVMLIVWGWALGCRSTAVAIYALLLMPGFHLRVVVAEEPWLARTFGDEWPRYKALVPRWFGSRRITP